MPRTTLLLAGFLLLTACSNAASDDPLTDSLGYKVVNTMPAGSFDADENGNFSGDLYVRGYATTETMREPFCMSNCGKFTYVFFHVLETGNEGLGNFLPVNDGNAYVGKASIGIGCLQDDGSIHYSNQSDAKQMQQFTIAAADAKKIMDASKGKPVTLHLSKSPLTGGTDAPACYSHFTNISL